MKLVKIAALTGKTIESLEIAVGTESSSEIDDVEIRFTDKSIWTLAIRHRPAEVSHHMEASVDEDYDGKGTVIRRPRE